MSAPNTARRFFAPTPNRAVNLGIWVVRKALLSRRKALNGTSMMLGVALVGYLSQGSLLKGMIMVVLGMLAATVGMDPMRGGARYDFGSSYLLGGIDIIVIAMGMFALKEIMQMIADPPGAGDVIKPPERLRDLHPARGNGDSHDFGEARAQCR